MKTYSIEELYAIYLQHPVITTDTRNIPTGSLFFALKGESFDGNSFAGEAIQKGASFAIIDNPAYAVNDRCIIVDNVLKTLQNLALHHRKNLQIPVIGVTGTNGKTTTKELTHAVLSSHYNCLATKGNLNNHIGVPLTLLSIGKEVEIAIVEMGANHPFEIMELCQIALPTHGIITNIGKAHLEGFGSYENIIKTKSELYESVKISNGTLFVNADNTLLMDLSKKTQRILYGLEEFHAEILPTENCLNLRIGEKTLNTQLIGNYNTENALAAICIGKYFKVPDNKIFEAIQNYTPSNNRSQFTKTEKNTLILDAYNANPTSMKLALENFDKLPAENKILFLGGMKELGNDSQTEHETIVKQIQTLNCKKVFLVGTEFEFAKNAANIQWFSNTQNVLDFLETHPIENALILLKGSRSIGMEKLVQKL